MVWRCDCFRVGQRLRALTAGRDETERWIANYDLEEKRP